MRRINQLSKSELVFYSKVILKIQILIISDKDFASKLLLDNKVSPRFLLFTVCFENAFVQVQFDRLEKTFIYCDILIPNGIFTEIINYN